MRDALGRAEAAARQIEPPDDAAGIGPLDPGGEPAEAGLAVQLRRQVVQRNTTLPACMPVKCLVSSGPPPAAAFHAIWRGESPTR